ncbi:hypothetical protein BJ742DRAFT_736747 [Cladochytrium replicatum]|nr:hypothetical protein BJ742DRAFT_736747 [Cladochytrium replicatum]
MQDSDYAGPVCHQSQQAWIFPSACCTSQPKEPILKYRVNDTDPDILDREKKKTLEGDVVQVISNAEGWNEAASISEAAVKADRAPEESISILVRESLDLIAKKDLCANPNQCKMQDENENAEGH